MLAVGDSTNLEIIFSTKKYKGRQTKRPVIKTNEGTGDQKVTIIAHIVTRPDSTYPVVIQPYKLDLSQFTEKIRDKITFTISNVSDEKLECTLVSMPVGMFDLKLPKSIGPGEKEEVVLKLIGEATKKSFNKSITIEFNDEKASRFTIPVKRTLRVAGTGTTNVKSGGK